MNIYIPKVFKFQTLGSTEHVACEGRESERREDKYSYIKKISRVLIYKKKCLTV